MSRLSTHPIVEWSPNETRILVPGGQVFVGADLKEVWQQAGKPSKVVLALPRRASFVKETRLPDVAREEAKAVLKFRMADEFPVPDTDLASDFAFVDDRNMDGRLAVLVAAKSDVVRQAKDALKPLAQIVQIVPTSVGAAALVPQGDAPTVVVDAAEGGVTFDVVRHGHVTYSRVSQASPSGDGIQAELMRTMASAKVSTAFVVACKDVRLPSADSTVDSDTFRALHQSTTELDLRLPEETFLAEKKVVGRRRRLAMLLVAAATCVWAMAVLDRLDAQDEVKAENLKWDQEIDMLETFGERTTTAKTGRTNETVLLVNAYQPKQPLSDVASVIGTAVPSGVWLTGITLERGKPIQIRGTATSEAQISAFIGNLNAMDRFRNVELAFSNTAAIDETQVAQFSITAHVVGNFPVTDPSETKRGGRR